MPNSDSDRLELIFDPEQMAFWPTGTKRKTKTNRIPATVLHYVDNPGARTPTGGKFRSIRFTVNIDGRKWVGQVKKDTDIVRLRPADE